MDFVWINKENDANWETVLPKVEAVLGTKFFINSSWGNKVYGNFTYQPTPSPNTMKVVLSYTRERQVI